MSARGDTLRELIHRRAAEGAVSRDMENDIRAVTQAGSALILLSRGMEGQDQAAVCYMGASLEALGKSLIAKFKAALEPAAPGLASARYDPDHDGAKH